MIIKKLVLHNFGVYASENSFIFNDEKPVVLIGGMNGRGKTTFLEAILLALYGSNSFAFQESKQKSYGTYLRAHTNIADGTKQSFVELEFDMNDEEDNNTYVVKRSWNINGRSVKDEVKVQKNGIEDTFLTQNWSMFIESVLPSALANFYFFDGEKIAELAEGETSTQMKNSIKALLGINVIDLLESDLNRIINRLKADDAHNYDMQRISELQIVKNEKARKLNDIDEMIASSSKDYEETCKKLETKREEFNAKGGKIAGESKELYSERIALAAKLESIHQEYIDLAASEMPLLLVEDRIRKISAKSTEERDGKSLQIAIDKISNSYEAYRECYPDNAESVLDFISFIQKKADESTDELVYDLSENAYTQGKYLIERQLEEIKKEYKNISRTERKIEKRLNEIENYLAVDIDEKAIQKIYKKICQYENRKTELEVKIDALQKKRTTANGELMLATSIFNKYVEKSLSEMERNEDINRMQIYAMLAYNTAGKYKIQLQRAKISNLAETMTKCYKKLLGKQNLIDRIEMDPDTLDYKYIDASGEEVLKNGLSAGEKQLMVIAMLWALAECSNKKLPVIIDTPLARLDSYHRTALIERYFPFASDQTVILSTDSEINTEYYKIIKPFVSNEFTLVYDENEKRSYVKNGYFTEAI